MEEQKKYRANRKAFYMTYAQSGELTAERILENFESIGEVEKYLIAKELHKDGQPHHHCYIVFKKKHNFKDCRWADIDGHHPCDHGSIKDPALVIRYCTKEASDDNKNYITNFYEVDPYALALASGDYNLAIETIKRKRPRDYVLYSDKIEHTLKKQCAAKSAPKFTLDQYKVEPFDLTSPLVPVIYGEAGTGKTQFAKAHFKNPLLVRHIDKLKTLNYPAIHDGIVFDEITIEKWPSTAAIALFDKEEDTDVNVKCTHVTIPAGCPRIFCINYLERLIPEGMLEKERKGLERRMNQLYVTESLIK